jgi:hypothetical protein
MERKDGGRDSERRKPGERSVREQLRGGEIPGNSSGKKGSPAGKGGKPGGRAGGKPSSSSPSGGKGNSGGRKKK